MRKYIAKLNEYTWVDFTPEQYRELNIITITREEQDVSCKIIPIGNFEHPDFWICYPVQKFEVIKEA